MAHYGGVGLEYCINAAMQKEIEDDIISHRVVQNFIKQAKAQATKEALEIADYLADAIILHAKAAKHDRYCRNCGQRLK